MRRYRKTQRAFSAGGVVIRDTGSGPEVVVCMRNRAKLACLPKGTPEPGEEPLETALREVREETGLEVKALSELGDIEYWFVEKGTRIHKTVRWWLMAATGGDVNNHDHEFDLVKWMPLDEAVSSLSFADERNVLAKAESQLGVETS